MAVITALVFFIPLFNLSAADVLSRPASDYSSQVADLFWVLLAVCGAFFALIVGVMLIVFFRFRAKKAGEEGRIIHGNTALEIVWTAIPFALMFVFAIASVNLVLRQVQAPADTLIVRVTAYQFGWDFEYYQASARNMGSDVITVKNICGNPSSMVKIKKLDVKISNEFLLPQGRAVRFLITSKDVIHSLWIPDFLIKRDTVPGLTTDFWLTPSRTGEFGIVCAALCGNDHAEMTGKVKVVPPEKFDQWMSEQKTVTLK